MLLIHKGKILQMNRVTGFTPSRFMVLYRWRGLVQQGLMDLINRLIHPQVMVPKVLEVVSIIGTYTDTSEEARRAQTAAKAVARKVG